MIFPLAIVEGPIVTIIASFLTSVGYLNVYLVYAIAVIGDIIGDMILYFIGYFLKNSILDRKSFLGISKERFIKLESYFKNHGAKTLVFGKLTHSLGFAILISAGMVKMPLRNFVWYNFISTLPKSLALVLIGYYFGKSYQSIGGYVDYLSIGIFCLLVIAIFIFYFSNYRVKEEL